MQKHLWFALTALCALLAFTGTAHAQFETGGVYLGPHIGIGSVGGTVAFGGDIEYGITRPGEAGSGRISIGGTLDYWSRSDTYYNYTWVPVGIFGAYHFSLSNRKLDPYLGLGLGYEIVTSSWKNGDNTTSSSASYNSGTYLNLVAGFRYFVSPGFALQARAGLGASLLSVGINFAL